MKPFPLPVLRRSLEIAAISLVAAALGAAPAHAATPRDTLVVAFAFDDIITMDPAEAFEISAGEIMGNTYDRLVRFDVNDPSKLYGDIAKTWTVGTRRQDLRVRVEARAEVRVGQRAHRRGRRVLAAAGGAARQDAGLHPDPVRVHQGQREGPDQADGPVDIDHRDREIVRAVLRSQLPDRERRRRRRQEARAVEGGERRPGLWLAQDQLRRLRPVEAPRVARQRDRRARAQRQLLRREVEAAARHLPAREGGRDAAPAAGEGRCRRRAQSDAAGPGRARRPTRTSRRRRRRRARSTISASTRRIRSSPRPRSARR